MRIRYTATTLCGSGYLQSAFLNWIRPPTQNANTGYMNGTQLGHNSIYAKKEKSEYESNKKIYFFITLFLLPRHQPRLTWKEGG